MDWEQRNIMSDAASGGSGPTNETNNDKYGFNGEDNKNKNSCRPYRSGDRYSAVNLKIKVEGMLNLGMKKEKHTDSFMVFHKEFHAYILDNYKETSDITYLVS